MGQILVFGGTKEGRVLADFLEANRIESIVSVATEYGKEILPKYKFCKIIYGRMDEKEIENCYKVRNISLVIDATHPYATKVTKNIKKACQNANIRYVRVLRKPDEKQKNAIYFKNIKDVVKYINLNPQVTLLTTGSKELADFREVNEFSTLLYARILPLEKIYDECEALGYKRNHLIGEMGPFSVETNIEHLKKIKAKYLVTKDTGKEGGFLSKIQAAVRMGVIPLVIERDSDEPGVNIEEAERIIQGEKNL